MPLQNVDSERYLFLSYASADRERALDVADALESSGMSVWIDRRGIAGGDLWAAEITEAIRQCATLAVLCSSASIVSRNVRQELQLAWDYERPILPLMLEPTVFPSEIAYFVQGRQWIDVPEDSERNWLPLVARALRSHKIGLDAQAGVASPVASAAPPTNLPLLPLSVIGRSDDIVNVSTLLRSGTRLLTLTGPGGVGKTTLAVATATSMLTDYRDGVWFIDLAAAQTVETAIVTVAQGAGIRQLGAETTVPDLAANLRTKRMLLLFDNAEHLPGIGEMIGGLLTGAPALVALVTSRKPLHLRIEREFSVSTLPAPTATSDFESIEESAAVRVFVERARQIIPSFVLEVSNASAIAAICARLDGLPLALELAAARSRLFTPAQLLERIEQNLSVLKGTAADAPDRQRALSETVFWSVNLLAPEEQALFRRLAVFTDGFSFEAAEAAANFPVKGLAGSIDVVQALDTLVDSNLVIRTLSPGGDIRFRMLSTIHDIARELLNASAEDLEVRDRHAAWCLELSHTFRAGRFEGFEWMRTVPTELPDLRAALAWLEQRRDAVAYKTIAGNLALAWNVVFNWEAQQIFRRAPGRDDPSEPAVQANFLAGWLNADKEWFERNGTLDARFAELRNLCASIGDTFGGAFAAHEWASVCASRRNWDGANESLTQARSMWQSIPLPAWDGMTAIAQGAVAFYRGDLEDADRRLREALDANLAAGDVIFTACCEAWLGLASAALGRTSVSASHALNALQSLRANGMLTMLAGWAGAAAWIVRGADPENAWMLRQALRIQQATGYNYNLATVNLTLLADVPVVDDAQLGREAMSLEALTSKLEECLRHLEST